MVGHGQKLSRRQERLIAALLTEPTHAAAAARTGVGETTLHRWFRLPAFQAAYRQARRAIVEGAIGRLQQSASKAVQTLERDLDCGHSSNEIRAALGLLDHAVKAIQLLDVVERVEELECLMKEMRDEPKEPLSEVAARGPEHGSQARSDDPPPTVPERDVGRTAG